MRVVRCRLTAIAHCGESTEKPIGIRRRTTFPLSTLGVLRPRRYRAEEAGDAEDAWSPGPPRRVRRDSRAYAEEHNGEVVQETVQR